MEYGLRRGIVKKLSLNEMLEDIKPKLIEKKAAITPSVATFFNGSQEYVVFLSATDGKERAIVVTARANTFEASWKQVTQNLRKRLFTEKVKPSSVKADLVTTIETVAFSLLLANLSLITRNHFRKGISFDKLFRNAFLEQEINANVFFDNWRNRDVEVAALNINTYIKENRKSLFRVDADYLNDVHLFETVSVFHDGNHTLGLCDGIIHNGRRDIDVTATKEIYQIIHNASQMLAGRIDSQGRFDYVYYPAFDKGLDTYNVIHHAISIHSMIEAYELAQDDALMQGIGRGLSFIIEETLDVDVIAGTECIFVKEKESDNEISLGASAHVLLALTKYLAVFGDKTVEPILDKLVNGIIHLQQMDGSFIHILSEDKTLKQAYHSPYYVGAAILSLVRFQQLKPTPELVAKIELSLRNVIDKDYWKRGDHCLNHAAIEFFYQNPKIEYAEWSLRCVKNQLNHAFTQGTNVKTLLELFIPTYFLINVIKENNIASEVLTEIDEKKLLRAILLRAKQQLNAYVWPEQAMYFAKPDKAVNSFFEREDSFRIRIDDFAYNIASYYYLFAMLQDATEKGYIDAFSLSETNLIEAEMLLLATQYEKVQQWEKGIACFEFMDENTVYMDITYSTYGMHLQSSGRLTEARDVLGKGNAIYPRSEAILIGLLKLSVHSNDFKSVIVIAGDLIKIDPRESQYYFELGRGYAELNDREKAQSAFKIGLIYKHDISTEKLIEEIESGITDYTDEINSIYTYLGGMNNVGVMIHEINDQQLFTKITKTDLASVRERLFYEEILPEFEMLAKVVPGYITTKLMNDLQYMTMEKIDNIKKEISVDEVIHVTDQITAVPFEKIVEKFPNPNYLYTLQHNIGPPIVRFFTQIHRKEQNELLFKTLHSYAVEAGVIEQMLPVLNRIEKVIMENKVYNMLTPKVHYSLLHGDFKLDNMSIRESDNLLQVLDWGAFAIGPRFMDMVYFFGSIAPEFREVKKKYIENIEMKRPLEIQEKIYFSFALCLFYFIKIKPENAEKLIENSMLPLVEYMEECVMEL